MINFALAVAESKKVGLFALIFSVLLVASGFSYGETAREPVAGEKVVILDVTKMT